MLEFFDLNRRYAAHIDDLTKKRGAVPPPPVPPAGGPAPVPVVPTSPTSMSVRDQWICFGALLIGVLAAPLIKYARPEFSARPEPSVFASDPCGFRGHRAHRQCFGLSEVRQALSQPGLTHYGTPAPSGVLRCSNPRTRPTRIIPVHLQTREVVRWSSRQPRHSVPKHSSTAPSARPSAGANSRPRTRRPARP